MDGIYCRIQNLFPFVTELYSNKFRGPGLIYEIALSISEVHIVWGNRPYPFRSYLSEKNFNIALRNKFLSFEYVLCEIGYKGMDSIHAIDGESSLLDRHETVHRRTTNFNVL